MFDPPIGAAIGEIGIIHIFLPILGEFVPKNSDFFRQTAAVENIMDLYVPT